MAVVGVEGDAAHACGIPSASGLLALAVTRPFGSQSAGEVANCVLRAVIRVTVRVLR
jgi:hypothetical protein